MPLVRTRGTIVECRFVTEEIKWFKIRLADPVDFHPGQYANIRFLGESKYHAFSIASSSAQTNELELVVKREREFTTRLLMSPLGTELEVMAPLGRFMAESDGDVIMIAGGVGVTPFLSTVRSARDKNLKDRQYWLFYSVRTRNAFFNEEELRRLPSENSNIHLVLTMTREQQPVWDGEYGHFSREMLLKHLASFENKTFYTCGPTKMAEEMVKVLVDAGVPKERVRMEAWG